MLSQDNISVLEEIKTALEENVEEMRSITFINLSGDITITWSASDDEKVKEIIRKKIKEGFSFFSLRKVVVDTVKVKRKVGSKGVDKLDNLVIDDETFEKMVSGMHDPDLAQALKLNTTKLAKRRGHSKKYDSIERLKTVEDVIDKRQSLAVRPIVGG